MKFRYWHYFGILFLLYFWWGGFFTSESLANQLVFNFAVFYPVGLLDGYYRAKNGIKQWISVFLSAFIFNAVSYLLVLWTEIDLSWNTVVLDFLTMFLIVYLGMIVGKRSIK
ncbi:MAG: hypothetical protein M0T74_06565 [Desulfitobacterium hafniense]|nr:hypothetical protein [Desulfitobacterium hafniense]